MSGPSRRGRVTPFQVMEVLKAVAARRARGLDVALLCVGQPATAAPAPVRAAARDALASEVLGYTEAAGVRPLREAIARHYRETYQVPVDPDQVVVTTGSSGGFLLALLAAFDAGDGVAMARPGYPAYRNDLATVACRVLDVGVDASTRFQPTAALLELLPETPKGVVVASPSNPTGTIIDTDELGRLSRWCRDADAWLISDEIYHGISYGRTCSSAWEFDRERTIVVGSFSKFWSMTGWRIGWLLVPTALQRAVELLQGNLAICPPTLSQWASVAAFDPASRDECAAHVERYAVNRDVLLRRLPKLGITSYAPPDGAFYAWCDVTPLTDDSHRWCAELLDATGVALTPGVDFDQVDGHRFVRLSFCCDTAELERGLDLLESFLR